MTFKFTQTQQYYPPSAPTIWPVGITLNSTREYVPLMCVNSAFFFSYWRDLLLFGIHYCYDRKWEPPKHPSSTLHISWFYDLTPASDKQKTRLHTADPLSLPIGLTHYRKAILFQTSCFPLSWWCEKYHRSLLWENESEAITVRKWRWKSNINISQAARTQWVICHSYSRIMGTAIMKESGKY